MVAADPPDGLVSQRGVGEPVAKAEQAQAQHVIAPVAGSGPHGQDRWPRRVSDQDRADPVSGQEVPDIRYRGGWVNLTDGQTFLQGGVRHAPRGAAEESA